jgi:hypothetical protein
MDVDSSWDVMPVANPDLSDRKRVRAVDRSLLHDPVGLAEPKYQVRDRDQIVVPSALDRVCRELLLRVQTAISLALDSDSDEVGLSDAVPLDTLLRHEWEIATALRNITELRAEHGFNAAASAGPITNAVLESHRRALQQAQDAISARVRALEQYAAQVSAAHAAYQDWQGALRMSHLNDRYLDLVARTAADEHANAEISDLTEQVATAAQAFQLTVQRVSLAAATLVLPEVGTR